MRLDTIQGNRKAKKIFSFPFISFLLFLVLPLLQHVSNVQVELSRLLLEVQDVSHACQGLFLWETVVLDVMLELLRLLEQRLV